MLPTYPTPDSEQHSNPYERDWGLYIGSYTKTYTQLLNKPRNVKVGGFSQGGIFNKWDPDGQQSVDSF